MKKQLIKIFDSNWFFVSLLSFVFVIPFSQALVSIFAGIMLFTALAEDSWKNKLNRLKSNKIILFIPAVFGIYLLSSFLSGPFRNSLYDLQKSLFYLVIPLAFSMGKNINSEQKRFLFYGFSFAVLVSSVIALITWILSDNVNVLSVHKISLISHIRFSFQLILVFWFFIILIYKNSKPLGLMNSLSILLIACYFLFFLFFQQSLTGLISFVSSLIFFTLYIIFRRHSFYKVQILVTIFIVVAVSVIYIYKVVHNFYAIEKIDKNTIDKTTRLGNLYQHDFNNPLVENGKYVYLFICEPELREEWNKISNIKFDSIGVNGYPISATLIRYMTSKGLRKDADGIHALDSIDVRNVENGIANVIFQKKKYSLYPRIYQTIWEYYVYSKTGNANQQSFSQRIEYAKAALTIIRQNFWFGVGTGQWKEEFSKAYQTNHSKLQEINYASSHNQYLNYMVKFGFTGFILILFFIIYPIYKTDRFKDILFLIFLVFMFFSNFADSNLESHMGSSFFVFFYCLFLITDGINYTLLPKKSTGLKV